MSTPNIQNNIPLQSVQKQSPVAKIPAFIPPEYLQGQGYVCNPVEHNNYIPRYMPLIQQGQVYPIAVPGQMNPAQNCPNIPKPGGVSAVNITINGVNSPTSGAASQMVPAPDPPVMPYYLPTLNPIQETKKELLKEPVEPKKEQIEPKKEPEPKQALEKKTEEKSNKKPVVELTDVYIQQLEKKLNNQDKNERAHAVAELVNRFKEDEKRKDDPRLTNLLNLALQDDSKPVVFAAMQALENGYANGNQVTEQRLQAIIQTHDTFGNSETAEGLLANLSTKQQKVKTTNDAPGQKLNLVAE